MKNGQCPKRDSREVYVSLKGGGMGDGFCVQVLEGESMAPTHRWQTLLCTACGYDESYLLDEMRVVRNVESPEKAGWRKIS